MNLETLVIVSGATKTKEIVEKEIIPLIDNKYSVKTIHLENNNHAIENIGRIKDIFQSKKSTSEKRKRKDALVAIGGGKIMDYVKVASFQLDIPWISVPTSASHDGFSSPFINFVLRTKLSQNGMAIPKTAPPLAIIGDTTLIARAPFEHVISGAGDLVAKEVAVKDWELAARIKGEKFDEYASTFSLMSAKLVEEGYPLIAKGKEPGIRLVVKALGNSGVAMAIAGNTRPASGSEHLISHYLDYLAEFEKKGSFKSSRHGFQVGLATILCSYLQGGDWKKLLHILEEIRHPTTAQEIGIDRDILLEAMTNAHKIRPERYTILGEGLSKKSAIKAMDATGIA